jgi:hypothetical protein
LGLTGATTAMPALSLAAMRAFLAVSATDGLVLFLLALLTSASLVFRSLFGSKRWSDAFKKKEKRKKKKEQEQVKSLSQSRAASGPRAAYVTYRPPFLSR